ncbi:MAG: hypothetical protein AB8G96_09015 [Phycisphaerales bacterium]
MTEDPRPDASSTPSTPPPAPATAATEPPFVAPEGKAFTCPGCRYELTGLSTGSVCPECGFDVAGRELSAADPAYLAQMHAGLRRILLYSGIQLIWNTIAVIISLGLGVWTAMQAFQNPGAFTNPGGGPPPTTAMPMFMHSGVLSPFGIFQVVLYVLFLTLSALLAHAWWHTTEPDPGRPESDNCEIGRTLIRYGSIAIVVGAVFNVSGIFQTTVQPGTISVPIVVVASIVGLISLAAMLARFFGQIILIQWIASRMPDEAIVARARLYVWLLPVIAIVGLCLGGIGVIVASAMMWFFLRRFTRAVGRFVPAT